MTFYSPAEVVDKTGFSLDTLRYYEKIGLLVDVARNGSGRRVYGEDHLAWLGLLRCLRDTGMPIAEMLRYTQLARAGGDTMAERLALLQAHDQRVEERIALLCRQREHIQWKIGLYRDKTSELTVAASP